MTPLTAFPNRVRLLGAVLLCSVFAVQAQPRIVPPPAHTQQQNKQTKQPQGALEEQDASSGGYTYRSVPDDPSNTRIYTLDNGLTVYLSRNADEPRIQTYVAVRAGSKMDPPQTTGLAHYLEHMLFKGTDQIGTMDWKLERQKLEQISKLYEDHRKESDPEKKAAIYAQIDRVSAEAAQLAIPNEYDKMLSAMGAKGTNAWTSKEQTVYTNDIPANELERWADLESLRFETLVLRLFHTELEAVYEEFNMNQDRDSRKVWDGLFGLLYPDHTYGSQNTIGKGEHLKNPSMVNIQNYFERYYVPSNMAVCLSGDIEYDQAIALVDQTFGQWDQRELLPWEVPPIKPLGGASRQDQTLEVFGLEAEQVMLGWRMPGADPYQSALALMVDGILSNGQAGLVDLDLVQAQKVLDAGTYYYELDDYSAFLAYGNPREGQSLEELRGLLEAQVRRVVDGQFPEWLLEAVANDQKLQMIRSFESNRGRAGAHVSAFTLGMTWAEYLNRTEFLQRIKKPQVVEFARTIFTQPKAVVYKRKGEDPGVVKVEKPPITPVEANREAVSPYVDRFMKRKVKRVDPVFVNYKEAIEDDKLSSGVAFSSIRNTTNDLFQLYYILDMGRDHDPYLPHAINYLPFLGVDTASAADLAKAFYRLGLDFDVSASDEKVYVSLRGLGDNLEAGVELFEYILAHAQPDAQAWSDYVDGVLKKREDAKSSKSTILWRALYDYARYEGEGPFLDKLSAEELRNVDPEDLVRRIQDLTSYEHRVFYYGAERPSKVMALLNREHQVPGKLKKIPDPTEYTEAETGTNKVYFVHYDMVQAQVVLMAKGPEFDKKLAPMADLFNSYFGSGLSSIVFQEIRETRALAYSAFAAFSTPAKEDEAHWVRAYVATQADKLPEAIPAMRDLLEDMPEADRQFQAARESVLKRIETDRITKAGIYWSREANARRGIKYDFRENVYNTVSDADLDELDNFFNDEIAGKTYTYLVLGDRDLVDMDLLRSLGDFSELSLEAIFGY